MFTDGIGVIKGLSLKSPLLRMEGSGKIDLPEQHLYYHATVALVKSCEGQGGKGLHDLPNYPIPVTISGPIGNLEVKPNLTVRTP
ncbi:MAG: hypothetical protein JRJ04_04340 [Deltaproteobacteria bacterium]|nr:hypothetical protein [Deltaproteobacteria bacterium]